MERVESFYWKTRMKNQSCTWGSDELNQSISTLILLNKCLEEDRIPKFWKTHKSFSSSKKATPLTWRIRNQPVVCLFSTSANENHNEPPKLKIGLLPASRTGEVRKGFGTTNHSEAVRERIEKCTEYNVPLGSFSMETWAVMTPYVPT